MDERDKQLKKGLRKSIDMTLTGQHGDKDIPVLEKSIGEYGGAGLKNGDGDGNLEKAEMLLARRLVSKALRMAFLVACTRLYTPLCRSVRRSVRPSVRHTLLFL